VSDLERDSYGTGAVGEDDSPATLGPATTVLAVANLSWVNEDYWFKPALRGIPRAQTFPTNSAEYAP
jgi:hypothetical protein